MLHSSRSAPDPTAGRPPLAPLPLERLIASRPAAAAAVLAAMRPAMYRSQTVAHASLAGVSTERVAEAWALLLRAAGLTVPTKRCVPQSWRVSLRCDAERLAGRFDATQEAACLWAVMRCPGEGPNPRAPEGARRTALDPPQSAEHVTAAWPAPAACALDIRALLSRRVHRTRRPVRAPVRSR